LAEKAQGPAGTTSIRLDPPTVALPFQSNPSGLQIVVASSSAATPFTRTVIIGSTNSVSAKTPQSLNGAVYVFSSWSDGGAATQNIVAPAAPATYTATYRLDRPPVAVASATPTSGSVPLTVRFDGSGSRDPDPGDTLTYAWDLDGDGAYDDSTAVAPSYTYTKPGQRTITVRLRVTDNYGAFGTTSLTITTTKKAAAVTKKPGQGPRTTRS
jgi:PKD repeat protein